MIVLDQEVGFHILRLFNSGFFDTFPKLKLVIGHMGEMLTFQARHLQDLLLPFYFPSLHLQVEMLTGKNFLARS